MYMKKILMAVSLCLLLAGAGVMTSCDSDTINQILSMILGGQTYTYGGTAQLQCLAEYSEARSGYTKEQKGTANIQVQLQSNSIGGTCTLTIPAITVGEFKMGQITLSGLQLTGNSAQTQSVISINEESGYGIDGKITYGSAEHDAYALYLKPGSNYATSEAISLELTIYFDESQAEAVNFTFSGNVVTAN